MKILYPDYDNCIANLACSVMEHFGVEPPNPTLPLADGLLDKRYKNVVVMLLDGMGNNIIGANLMNCKNFVGAHAGLTKSLFSISTHASDCKRSPYRAADFSSNDGNRTLPQSQLSRRHDVADQKRQAAFFRSNT